MRFLPAALLLIATTACAQLIPTGQPIPKRSSPPVVFLDGYESGCTSPSDFASYYVSADRVLQTANLASVYFGNCTVPGNPAIEVIGQAFGQFLAGLKYDDGTPVTQVDVIAHSMGGLILRSYLSGKQPSGAAVPFLPPVKTGIRKAILLGTPHFGSPVASLAFGNDPQSKEMSLGSSFLFDLATWNQGTDDLRGIDALAIGGNSGNGLATGLPGFDDGVVGVTSSSIAFAMSGRTRLLPICHTGNPLISLSCPGGTSLNRITDATTDESKMILSFLTGTSDWQSLGQAIEANSLGSSNTGLLLNASTATGQPLVISSGTYNTTAMQVAPSAYTEHAPAGTSLALKLSTAGGTSVTATRTFAGGTTAALTLKDGPFIGRILPAAAATFPYSLAGGEFTAIYGLNLTTASAAATQPYPTQLGDVQVTVNNTPVPLQFAGPTQVNVILPDLAPGLYPLTIKNAAGQHTVNVLIEAAVPALFTQNASGSGPASALNALTGIPVTAAAPLRAGDYVSLYLTGLGLATPNGGLSYANVQPTVTVGGKTCAVSFAGRNPSYSGLDQINCQIPTGLASGAQPVVVTSGTRTANAVTIAVQ